jgi:hypothetical protein
MPRAGAFKASRLIYLFDTAGDRTLSNSCSACITPSIGVIAVRTSSTSFKALDDQQMLIGILTTTWGATVWRAMLNGLLSVSRARCCSSAGRRT